jgi:hypothetical protein
MSVIFMPGVPETVTFSCGHVRYFGMVEPDKQFRNDPNPCIECIMKVGKREIERTAL